MSMAVTLTVKVWGKGMSGSVLGLRKSDHDKVNHDREYIVSIPEIPLMYVSKIQAQRHNKYIPIPKKLRKLVPPKGATLRVELRYPETSTVVREYTRKSIYGRVHKVSAHKKRGKRRGKHEVWGV